MSKYDPTPDRLEAYPTPDRLEAYPTPDRLEAYPTQDRWKSLHYRGNWGKTKLDGGSSLPTAILVACNLMNEDSDRLPVIGWREWVGLPELGIKHIKAKVDTGARSSSLHAIDIEEVVSGEKTLLRFKVQPAQHTDRVVEVEAELLEYRHVRSSSGKATSRPVILTSVKILGQTYPIELTLANRSAMGFRMLLGREAFRKRLLVDAGNSYYGGRPPRRKKS